MVDGGSAPPRRGWSPLARRRISWLLVIVSLVSLTLAAAWAVWRVMGDYSNDPRAYPGSEIRSLKTALKYYHIRLPDCARESVRFAQYDQLTTDSLYLFFSGDDHCIPEFLAVNGLDDEQTVTEEGLPFRPTFGAEFGWPRDKERKYITLRGTVGAPDSQLVDILIAIDYTSNPHNLYLRAGII